MTDEMDPTSSRRVQLKEYSETYKRKWKEQLKDRQALRAGFEGLVDVVCCPDKVDMKTFCGTEIELSYALEALYANDSGKIDSSMELPPGVLSWFGTEFALHSQGIYYRNQFSIDLVTCNRKVWLPSLSKDVEESRDTIARQGRAKVFALHSRNNEKWCKSEYAWEADAWSDVFGHMKDDPCLAIDKHDYTTFLPHTDPISCKMTGKGSFVKRVPDVTFGLASFTEGDADLDSWTPDLLWNRLEQLMLHPKYGLFSDPNRLGSDLIFPFMVYEAKGWSGDCRVARRQACSAAAFYLDMLDELARQPGPVGIPKTYQMRTSHQYQVFVLTSFGAYWHLSVGYRRPRLKEERAGEDGMSDTVYLFQNFWSGHVTDKNVAYELLDLLDQIHLWAKTEHRSFVLAHLQPWHKLCEENYLLTWRSKYEHADNKKRKRTYSDTENLQAPSWVQTMSKENEQKFQALARLSLDQAVREGRSIKGESPLLEGGSYFPWVCNADGCIPIFDTEVAFTDHMRSIHNMDDRRMANLKWCLRRKNLVADIRERVRQGVMATGHKWISVPKPIQVIAHSDTADIEIEQELVSYDRLRPRKRRELDTLLLSMAGN